MNPAAVEKLRAATRRVLKATRYRLEEITPHPDGFVFARAWSEKGDRYSRGCTYRKTYCNYQVRVPDDFDVRTAPIRGDGRLWLNCEPLNRFHLGYPVFRVTWLHKSAGFTVEPRWELALQLGSELVPESELPTHLCPS